MSLRRLGKLTRIFAKAVLGIALTATLGYAGLVEGAYEGKGEKLTPGEQQAVTQIFGDEVDASKIRKHFKANSDWTHFLKGKQGTVMPFTHHVDFFGDNIKSPDYSAEGAYKYGFFLHEMTHIWQGTNFAYPLKNFGQYEFTLTKDSKFADFGLEQQGEIIEAYAKAWLHPEGRKQPKTAQDTLLIPVVENRFPQAKITRETLDAASRQVVQASLIVPKR